ncbi:MAG TPA: hypothetical protein H9892_07130 [Candidatus Protoclostridium stercorigallinarum]|uniref:Uncharacterized protein n=1 Tax=Candidatus Protoclostridium stercorigallinarum TaxID=2838741 RepID=A0A9D1TRR6_9FIRM|nr:hypothetical protein [Candidatus Protoclostridium stercorigallinarum]
MEESYAQDNMYQNAGTAETAFPLSLPPQTNEERKRIKRTGAAAISFAAALPISCRYL